MSTVPWPLGCCESILDTAIPAISSTVLFIFWSVVLIEERALLFMHLLRSFSILSFSCPFVVIQSASLLKRWNVQSCLVEHYSCRQHIPLELLLSLHFLQPEEPYLLMHSILNILHKHPAVFGMDDLSQS